MTSPKDPPSGKWRHAAAGQHVDWAGREVSRPGAPVDELAATHDDFRDEPTPIREFHRLEQRVANVEAVAIEARLRVEQADSLPSTEWAQRIEARVKVCEDERADRAKWAWIWKWAKGIGTGGVLTALAWAVMTIGNQGAARESARRDADILHRLIDDVRALRESTAADHALIQVLLSTLRSTP